METLPRDGDEDTILEAKTKDSKQTRGQGQGPTFQEQTFQRPAKDRNAQDQGHNAQVFSKNKKSHRAKTAFCS